MKNECVSVEERVPLPHQAGVEEPERGRHEHDERGGHEDPSGVAGVDLHGRMVAARSAGDSAGAEESVLPLRIAPPPRRYSVVTVWSTCSPPGRIAMNAVGAASTRTRIARASAS